MSGKKNTNFATVSSIALKSAARLPVRLPEPKFEPYNWLKNAKIYNKKWQLVPSSWIIDNADIIVLLFTAKGVDRYGILKKFYHVYESTKYAHMPIEVIFLPMDEIEKDAIACFAEQANWFTLRFDDILIHTLKFMFGITCIPNLMVFKTNCEVISYDGIADLDLYDKNAVISWLTKSTLTTKQRRRSDDACMYGPDWKFVKQEEKVEKYEYHRKFKTDGEPVEDHSNLPGYSYPPEVRVKSAKRQSKAAKDSKRSESSAKLPDGRSKSASIAAPRPEGQSKLPDGRSKSASIAIQLPESRSKSASIAVQLPESRSKSASIAVQLPEGRSKSASMAVQLPESQAQLSEKRSKSASIAAPLPEGQAQLPEGRSKSASIAAPLPEGQVAEGRSKSAGAIPSEAFAKPSIIQIQLPDEHSIASENQAQPAEGGSKPTKSRVQLADDKPSESDAPPSESRSKSAVTQPSESNVKLKEGRSKSAKFADDS